MDSINDILSSVSSEDLEKLKGVASQLMSGANNGSDGKAPSQSADMLSSLLGNDSAQMLVKVMSRLNQESSKTQFIKALSPLLSEEKRKKAEEAARFLKLMDTLPLLRGMLG